MSLLKKLKKRLNPKNMFKNLKKDFKGFMKGFAKVMQNKWVKIAMLVVSLVVPVIGMATAGWASAAAQGAGFLGKVGGALSNVARGVASMVVKTVTTPVKAALNAGAKGAGMINANGLASTLSNAGKMVGNASTSLFGNVKIDSLGQIMQRWGGAADGAAQASGAVVDTAAGLGTASAPEQAGGIVSKMAGSAPLNDAAKTAGQFGDIASKVTADGALVAGSPGGGGFMQTAGGMVKGAMGMINKNPEVAKMAFSAISSATSPDEAELMEKQYKLQNQWRQDENKAWDSFSPNNEQATQASQQYGGAYAEQQPQPWRERAAAARQYISSPLLKRTYAGAYQ